MKGGAMPLGQRPRRNRTTSSTRPSVVLETAPDLRTRRSRAIVRTWSARMAERLSSPPSGACTSTCDGMGRTVEVIGRTETSSAGPLLKLSTESTSTGRVPRCSCPRVGFRSANQTSPRRGNEAITTASAGTVSASWEARRRGSNPTPPSRPGVPSMPPSLRAGGCIPRSPEPRTSRAGRARAPRRGLPSASSSLPLRSLEAPRADRTGSGWWGSPLSCLHSCRHGAAAQGERGA